MVPYQLSWLYTEHVHCITKQNVDKTITVVISTVICLQCLSTLILYSDLFTVLVYFDREMMCIRHSLAGPSQVVLDLPRTSWEGTAGVPISTQTDV